MCQSLERIKQENPVEEDAIQCQSCLEIIPVSDGTFQHGTYLYLCIKCAAEKSKE